MAFRKKPFIRHLEMATLIPTAGLVLMSGVRHFAMWEKTEGFNQIILDYLGR